MIVMNFWSIVGFFFWSFVFISYLFALFAVIGDLFRDRRLNGWWKAVWIIFLIFVPFATVFVYLTARGRGMAARSSRTAAAAQSATNDYIRSVANTSPADEIAQGKALLDAGTITPAEFESLKARALGATTIAVPEPVALPLG
jgi:ABC-type multidrug transport system fused ATPase/permease subunit